MGGACPGGTGAVTKGPGITGDGGRTTCRGACSIKADRKRRRPCRGRGGDDRGRRDRGHRWFGGNDRYRGGAAGTGTGGHGQFGGVGARRGILMADGTAVGNRTVAEIPLILADRTGRGGRAELHRDRRCTGEWGGLDHGLERRGLVGRGG